MSVHDISHLQTTIVVWISNVGPIHLINRSVKREWDGGEGGTPLKERMI